MVLEEYEIDPETYDAPLKKKLAEAGADKDEEIIKAAQELLKQLKLQELGSGKYSLVFSRNYVNKNPMSWFFHIKAHSNPTTNEKTNVKLAGSPG